MAEVLSGDLAAPEAASDPKAAYRLTTGQKLLYAFGDIADGLKNAALGMFLLLYLTGVIGLPGWMAGLATGTALLLDAVLDPLIGYWSDRTRSRWGRRHPFMLAAALPFSIALGLIFSLPHFDSPWLTFAAAVPILVLLRVAFSAFVLPYAALGAEVARDYNERSVLMTYRNLFNNCGVILALVLGYSVFLNTQEAMLSPEAYIPFGWTLAVLVLIAVLVSTFSSWRFRHLMHEVKPAASEPPVRVFSDFAQIFRNHSFTILFLTVLSFWISQGAAAVLANHTLLFFWKLPPSTIQYIQLAVIVGNVVGIPIVGWLLRRYEKRVIAAAGLAVFCACQLTPTMLYLAGIVPAGAAVPVMLWIAHCMIGIVATCVLVTFGSMMMDAADEHEFLFGVRREGLYFAGLIFSVKAAVGGGSVVAGIALDAIGFPQGIGSGAVGAIPEDTLTLLGIVAGPGAAIISLTSVLILLRYRLDRVRLNMVQGELETRRLAVV